MPKIKDIPKVMDKKKIIKRLKKECSVCAKDVNVIVYSKKDYRGGHYFFKLPVENSKEKVEYWECPQCYWGK